MRRLKVRYVLSLAGRPVLLSATLLGACAGHAITVGGRDSGADARASGQDVHEVEVSLPSADANQDAGFVAPTLPVVPTPAGGTLATLPTGCIDLGAIVGAGVDVATARTARVTMEWTRSPYGPDARATLGRIRVAPEIAGLVVGTPTVELAEKTPAEASDPVISNVRRDVDGFTFDVAWTATAPNALCLNGQEPSWTFRTTLRLQCGGQERIVESSTTVALCDPTGSTWASSGESCQDCAVVCEMAPSPVLPASVGDDLPLASALSVSVSALVRAPEAVVLLAKHAARDGLDYAWQVSAGTLEQLDRDLVLWRLPAAAADRAQLAQVAITGVDLAAVASFRWTRQVA